MTMEFKINRQPGDTYEDLYRKAWELQVKVAKTSIEERHRDLYPRKGERKEGAA